MVVRDVVAQAEERQKTTPGMYYAGAVLQHLVGAKLDCALGKGKFEHNSFSTADSPGARAGDFLLGDVAIHMGYRFRLHRKDLPGKPDLTFPQLHKVIFVHGCFWHKHDCARGARVPKQNRAYWLKKIAGNRDRDQKNLEKLAAAGWRSLVVWECATRNERDLRAQVSGFLAPGRDS